MDDFIIRALLAGVGVAVIAGPLGCLVVWRRMAYFGATLAHAALLGIALGLLFDVNLPLGILAVCVVTSLLLVALQRQKGFATDTLLGILAHATLALGLLVISFHETMRMDLNAYLFGDILAVGRADVIWICAGGAVCLAVLMGVWRSLLAITVHEDLARVDGERVALLRVVFLIMLSLVVAVAMQVVGLLLIVSMLIIPAAAARRLSITPEQMAVAASLLGCAAVVLGLISSLNWDTPAGPSIVVAATLLFVGSLLLPRSLRRAARQQPVEKPSAGTILR